MSTGSIYYSSSGQLTQCSVAQIAPGDRLLLWLTALTPPPPPPASSLNGVFLNINFVNKVGTQCWTVTQHSFIVTWVAYHAICIRDFLNNPCMIHLHPIFSPLYPLLSERTWPTLEAVKVGCGQVAGNWVNRLLMVTVTANTVILVICCLQPAARN